MNLGMENIMFKGGEIMWMRVTPNIITGNGAEHGVKQAPKNH